VGAVPPEAGGTAFLIHGETLCLEAGDLLAGTWREDRDLTGRRQRQMMRIRHNNDRAAANAYWTREQAASAPREGRPTTGVNWLVRQLKSAPESAPIECFQARARGSSVVVQTMSIRRSR